MKVRVRLGGCVGSAFAILILLGSVRVFAMSYSNAGANAYARAKNWQGLLQYATAWTRAEPNDPDGWAWLGAVYGMDLHQPAKAIAPIQRSLQLRPSAAGWHALGATYYQLGRYGNAEEAIRRAIQMNPNQPTYYNNLAAAYAEQARWKEASSTLDAEFPVAQRLNNVQVWYVLGNAYSRMEDAPKAVRAYQYAVRLDPRLGAAWTNLGTMLQWSGNVQGALQAYDRGAAFGNSLGAHNAAQLRAAMQRARATHQSSSQFGAIVASIAKQNHEAYLHNTGQLNLNEHLP